MMLAVDPHHRRTSRSLSLLNLDLLHVHVPYMSACTDHMHVGHVDACKTHVRHGDTCRMWTHM